MLYNSWVVITYSKTCFKIQIRNIALSQLEDSAIMPKQSEKLNYLEIITTTGEMLIMNINNKIKERLNLKSLVEQNLHHGKLKIPLR